MHSALNIDLVETDLTLCNKIRYDPIMEFSSYKNSIRSRACLSGDINVYVKVVGTSSAAACK